MSAYTELVTRVGDQITDAWKQAEDQTSRVVASFTDATAKLIPALDADVLPAVGEFVSANLAIVERALEAQKHFVLQLVEAGTSIGVIPAAPSADGAKG